MPVTRLYKIENKMRRKDSRITSHYDQVKHDKLEIAILITAQVHKEALTFNVCCNRTDIHTLKETGSNHPEESGGAFPQT